MQPPAPTTRKTCRAATATATTHTSTRTSQLQPPRGRIVNVSLLSKGAHARANKRASPMFQQRTAKIPQVIDRVCHHHGSSTPPRTAPAPQAQHAAGHATAYQTSLGAICLRPATGGSAAKTRNAHLAHHTPTSPQPPSQEEGGGGHAQQPFHAAARTDNQKDLPRSHSNRDNPHEHTHQSAPTASRSAHARANKRASPMFQQRTAKIPQVIDRVCHHHGSSTPPRTAPAPQAQHAAGHATAYQTSLGAICLRPATGGSAAKTRNAHLAHHTPTSPQPHQPPSQGRRERGGGHGAAATTQFHAAARTDNQKDLPRSHSNRDNPHEHTHQSAPTASRSIYMWVAVRDCGSHRVGETSAQPRQRQQHGGEREERRGEGGTGAASVHTLVLTSVHRLCFSSHPASHSPSTPSTARGGARHSVPNISGRYLPPARHGWFGGEDTKRPFGAPHAHLAPAPPAPITGEGGEATRSSQAQQPPRGATQFHAAARTDNQKDLPRSHSNRDNPHEHTHQSAPTASRSYPTQFHAAARTDNQKDLPRSHSNRDNPHEHTHQSAPTASRSIYMWVAVRDCGSHRVGETSAQPRQRQQHGGEREGEGEGGYRSRLSAHARANKRASPMFQQRTAKIPQVIDRVCHHHGSSTPPRTAPAPQAQHAAGHATAYQTSLGAICLRPATGGSAAKTRNAHLAHHTPTSPQPHQPPSQGRRERGGGHGAAATTQFHAAARTDNQKDLPRSHSNRDNPHEHTHQSAPTASRSAHARANKRASPMFQQRTAKIPQVIDRVCHHHGSSTPPRTAPAPQAQHAAGHATAYQTSLGAICLRPATGGSAAKTRNAHLAHHTPTSPQPHQPPSQGRRERGGGHGAAATTQFHAAARTDNQKDLPRSHSNRDNPHEHTHQSAPTASRSYR
eukprot:gene11640-8024_t